MITREDILKLIRNEAIVTFTKTNGEKRVMHCTTDMTKIPEDQRPVTSITITNQQNDDVLRVYDLEKNGWRSFRIDSVSAVQAA